MKLTHALIASAVSLAALCSCQDDVSDIGNSLTQGEVTISIDTLPTSIEARSIYAEKFDSRSLTKLLGRINVPQYGNLDCSFVSQLMAVTALEIPDSITEQRVDSLKLILSVPRGALTGDSLAPQQLSVYELTRQLPADIESTFNPDGYYSSGSLLGRRSYTISNLSLPENVFSKDTYIRIGVDMDNPRMAREVFNKYRQNPEVFQWPSTFNQYFPGIYVMQNFGNGCVANIAKTEMYLYWNRTETVYEKIKDAEGDNPAVYGYVDYIKRDSTCVFASQPEVLSSNIINYNVSESLKAAVEAGDVLITTPGGYYADIDFPLGEMIRRFKESSHSEMSVVSGLSMQIPASKVTNEHGIGVAPYLLMVPEDERESFFANNKVPDGVNSFYASYDAESGCYRFSTMRDYFLNNLEDYRLERIDETTTTKFSLVPVEISVETVSGYSSSTTYVTRCAPYLAKPTLTHLHADRAVITFTFSSQRL